MAVAALKYSQIKLLNLKNLIFDTVLLTEKNVYVRSIYCITFCPVFGL